MIKKIVNIFMPRTFPSDKNGRLMSDKLPRGWNKFYRDAIVRYLNYLEPLFEEARKKSEFQFILTLFRFRGIQPSRWDTYENSLEIYDEIMDIKEKVRGNTKLNLILWLYGHIVEASEPYETLANLLNICLGNTYRVGNFPKIKTAWGVRHQFPNEKIIVLEKMAKKAGFPDVVKPIKEIFDKDLRNGVFHSDYSVDNGQIILTDPNRIYSREETLKLTNQAMAYHECFKNVIKNSIRQYQSSKIISADRMSHNPDEKATLIIRNGYGVIAMKDAFTKEQIYNGSIPWFVGKLYSYERKLIEKGQYNLPKDRVEFWNKILTKLPSFIGKAPANFIDKYIING